MTVVLPSPAGVGIDAGDEDQAAGRLAAGDRLGADLGLVAPVGKNLVGSESDLSGHVGDGSKLGGLRDGDVGRYRLVSGGVLR